jgi:dipeptidyl aminopeptidase/acylaminoacyl peptidase
VAWTGKAEEYFALDGRNQQTRSVVIWNAANDSQQLLHRHADTDIEQASLDPSGRPWVFSGMGHFPVYWYPDPAHPLAKLHQALVRQLPREQVDITSVTDDMSFAVVRVSSGSRAALYFVMDVKAEKSLTGMNTYPKLKGTRLAPVDAIEFRARDGVLVHGYLTTPLDSAGKPRRQLPLVIVAHDGPGDAPSDFRYEFERQLLASRGFAVLQVNHRGVGGRGRNFERMGDGQWGLAVQDDYADAARWALKDGVAAPGRLCFYGTGLGAYSAVVTASRAPDLFKCVIGVQGVYDLASFFAGRRELTPTMQRAFGADIAQIADRSATTHAGTVEAKVLLMPQKGDDRVPVEQSSAMRTALRAAGNSPQWEMIGSDYSAYFTPQDRAAVYTKIIGFLRKQVGKDD